MDKVKAIWIEYNLRIMYGVSVVLLVGIIILSATRPSYELGGIDTGNLAVAAIENPYWQAMYEAKSNDYENIKNTLISTATELGISQQHAAAYAEAYNKILDKANAQDVNIQLLEANNKGLTQTNANTGDIHTQYDNMVAHYEDMTDDYAELQKNIIQVTVKDFFVVTENITQAEINTFYIGWEIWIKSLTEADDGN